MNRHTHTSARSAQGEGRSYPIIGLAFHVGRVSVRLLIAGVVAGLALVLLNPGLSRPAAAAPACTHGRTMNVVAFEDDDILFLNTDIVHDVQDGVCVRTVFVSAGDAGKAQSYWEGREAGSKAAYAEMAGVSDAWTQADAGITDHPMPVLTLTGQPTVSLVFMRLPDGNGNGSGFTSTGNESLQKLWQGDISQIDAVDGSSSYSKQQLIDTLAALMTSFGPDTVRTQDFLGSYGDGDHSDHHSTAYFAKAASPHYAGSHQLVGYLDYHDLPAPPEPVPGRPDGEAERLLRLRPPRQPGVPEPVGLPDQPAPDLLVVLPGVLLPAAGPGDHLPSRAPHELQDGDVRLLRHRVQGELRLCPGRGIVLRLHQPEAPERALRWDPHLPCEGRGRRHEHLLAACVEVEGRPHSAPDHDHVRSHRHGEDPQGHVPLPLLRAGLEVPVLAGRREVQGLLVAEDRHRGQGEPHPAGEGRGPRRERRSDPGGASLDGGVGGGHRWEATAAGGMVEEGGPHAGRAARRPPVVLGATSPGRGGTQRHRQAKD